MKKTETAREINTSRNHRAIRGAGLCREAILPVEAEVATGALAWLSVLGVMSGMQVNLGRRAYIDYSEL